MSSRQRSCLAALIALILFACCTGSVAEDRANDPHAWIHRAQEAMGMGHLGDRVIHIHAALITEENYQSDRFYLPFFSSVNSLEGWYGGQDGVERIKGQTVFPGQGPFPNEVIRDSKFSFYINDGKAVPLPSSALSGRYLNAWPVIHDWAAAEDVRFAGKEIYREYPRVVLTRETAGGTQRLFLDAKTGFPVKLDYEEQHYLWGQRHVEYIYSNWIQQGDIQVSGASFRVADGDVEDSETIGSVELIKAEKTDLLQMPPVPSEPIESSPRFLKAEPLIVTQVSPTTYLLTNFGYAEAVTLASGEIFLFDATQGEDRARLDSQQITKLFPGKHKITVVVTDLAWPHVAGVRYWVAQGATIISHQAAQPFLEKIVDRKWTLRPDQLERHRTKLRFMGVRDIEDVAGGKIKLVPIDGIGSEIALAGFVAEDGFLWASDYIQDLSQPTAYAADVCNAIRRAQLQPRNFAAEHVALTGWDKVMAVNHESNSTDIRTQ